ncbi:MAG: transcription elongation factor Spt5 [Candidatus Aenigmarchaeota archaeon]|nr:transcription elongation factor Spt5 [Candidatus Aenigmarchaeota archaeon]
MPLYAIKTVVGRENIAIDAIATRAQTEKLLINIVLRPEEIKGYIFIDGDLTDIEKVVQAVPHVRGIIKKAMDVKELQRFLQPKKVEVELSVKDVVEVIGGPFKGERGRVTRYDKVKREVTLELLDVAVPIPITVNVEFIKLLERGEG